MCSRESKRWGGSNQIAPDGFPPVLPRSWVINQPQRVFISGWCAHSQKRWASCTERLLLIYPQKVNVSLLGSEEKLVSHQLGRRWSQHITGTCRWSLVIRGTRRRRPFHPCAEPSGQIKRQKETLCHKEFSVYSDTIDRQIGSANYRLIFGLKVVVLSQLGTGILQ